MKIGGGLLARYDRRGYAIARGLLPDEILSKCRSIRVTKEPGSGEPVRWWLRQYLLPFGTAWSHLDISSVSSQMLSAGYGSGFGWTSVPSSIHWGPTVVIPLKQWTKHSAPLILPNSHSWRREPEGHRIYSPHAVGNPVHTAMRPGDALFLHPGSLFRFQPTDPPHGLWISFL